jgi:hypothetical protein
MMPSASAIASGRAGLSLKMPGVTKYELVRERVHVTLDGSTGHCTTEYTPPTLAARH